ncbi:hypothetical protein L207DRAFT_605003 [Hyaloscypha variabilis F]|uniref:Fumarylacetoacetase-like C-terminal domain-containing protein n=1 Tax=Hyaloscypha variabilis (strain UAMH 11265 / GT02V1 / F) TaxID=1149755 RepID=A0A2J6R780_HYAVF|nr:hypothetical protein L207DRAFT_605003 [Hyaloscypha variabilis F]
MSVERFIGFKDKKGSVSYRELSSTEITGNLEGKSATVLSSNPFTRLSRTDQKATIKKLLYPLELTHIFMCIGLNYARHVKEANGELCVIISKDAKNVSESEALNYVLGYTARNDVSARNFQIPALVSRGQFSYTKSFDGFAPVRPSILLIIGETRTNDMIWSVAKVIKYLSRGTTLRKGTVIITGTPSGIGLFMKPDSVGLLKNRDVVKIKVSRIGRITNKMLFE